MFVLCGYDFCIILTTLILKTPRSSLSGKLLRSHRCTNFIEIRHRDTLILEEGHRLLFTAKVKIHVSGGAGIGYYVINRFSITCY